VGRVLQETAGLYGEDRAPWTMPLPPIPREVRKRFPRSVRMCLEGSHKVVLWRRDGTGEPWEIPFRCRSWRCPKCRSRVGLVDYARVAQALETHGPWVYVVLTLPGHWRRINIWERYRQAGDLWNSRLRKRLQRRYGRVLYVQTWEQHRDGTPHVNVVLGGKRLIAEVDELGDGGSSFHPRLGRHVRVPRWRRLFGDCAREAGFGARIWVERLWEPTAEAPRPSDGLSSYMVKLSHNLVGVEGGRSRTDAAAGEVTRSDAKDQTPTAAPRGFRRLRASQRTLPPRNRSRELSGALRSAEEGEWHWGTVAEHLAKRADAYEQARATLRGLRSRGLPVPPRIVRLAEHGSQEQPA